MANGTGKTHISIALGTNLVNREERVRFNNAVDLINALIAEQAEGTLQETFGKMKDALHKG